VTNYDPTEIMAVLAARALKDGQVVFAGAGVPIVSSLAAQKLHAPSLTILFEVGAVAPIVEIGRIPSSANESRSAYGSVMLPSTTETLLFCQRGFVDVGFLGGAQIDKYGNLNTSIIGKWDHPKVRMPGSGGANDIASSTHFLIVTWHEKMRFVEKVDFITSPGYLQGGNSRSEAGLVGGGPLQVITHLGILGFDPDLKEMVLTSVHPGVDPKEVKANTGWDLKVSPDLSVTVPPTEEELDLFRRLDPERRFLKVK
jgi:glutaconate CoA-transferase subunit B